MSYYTNQGIGCYELTINNPIFIAVQGTQVFTTGGPTGFPIQFDAPAFIYEFNFRMGATAPSTIEVWKQWTAAETNGSALLLRATDGTEIYYPTQIPVLQNEALVVLSTATSMKTFTLIAGRYKA